MSPPQITSRLRRLLRLALRGVLGFLLVVVVYVAAAVVLGLTPVNADWQPSEEGTEVWVVSNGVHADFVLPVEVAGRDWRDIAPLRTGRQRTASHVQLGWGDRGFFLETKEWGDLTVGNALQAVFWESPSVMHVSFRWKPTTDGETWVRLVLDDEQLERLCVALEDSFARDEDGELVPIPDAAYHDDDAFWEARGSYHLFHTCNGWTNALLAEVGVRTAVWAPFQQAIFHHLE